MRKSIFFLVAFTALFIFQRCNNDIDLYADHKDITIVYCILDYSDDTTWIKITRAFSGPGDILQLAQNPDSSNYPTRLNVVLAGHKPGNDLPEIVFDTMTITNKRPGDSVFYFPDQLMYFAKVKLDEDATYHLNIEVNKKVVESETPLVKSFGIVRPRNTIDFTMDGHIDWNSAKNGKRYEVTYVFNYRELLPGSSDTTHKKVFYYVGNKLSLNTNGGEDMSQNYSGDAFYSRLNDELEKIPNVQRWAGNVDVSVSGGSQVLQNYLQINSAEGNLLEEVPLYTNITNGVGILASRHTTTRSVRLSNLSQQKLVNEYDLGFKLPIK